MFWFIELQVYKLPNDRFYATYFGGDEKAGLAPDNEARDIWLKYLPPERVLPFGCKVCFFLLLLFLACFVDKAPRISEIECQGYNILKLSLSPQNVAHLVYKNLAVQVINRNACY